MSYTSRQAAQESQQVERSANKVVSPKFTDQRASTSVQLKQQQLMQTAHSPAQLAAEEEEPLQGKFVVQRVEEEEPLQGKFATAQLAGMEEEEPIQGKFDTLQRAAEEEEPLQGKFESSAPAQREQKPNNTGMPDNLKSGIENLSGYSMDDVKVHYNSDKPSQLNAHAYAQGTDIHVAPGQEQHLPHEAWHVVQQKQGRVQPTMQMKAGVPVNDDVGLESEADVMGAKANSLPVTSAQNHTENIQPKLTTDGKNTYQLKKSSMILQGEDVVNTDTKINTFIHTRGGVHDWAAGRASELGPFSTIEAGATCNHHWGYASIQDKLIDKNIKGFSISDAAKNICISFEGLSLLPAAYATHKNSLVYAQEYQHIDRERFLNAMNYYIYKICDYPGNLFYWPDHDNTEPDHPGNVYDDTNIPGSWEFRDAVDDQNDGQEVFDDEIGRIVEGADEIKTQIAN